MIIALIIIFILTISLIGAIALSRPSSNPNPTTTPTLTATPTNSPTPNPTIVPYSFEISTDYPRVNITQGRSIINTIYLTTVGGNAQDISPNDVGLIADGGSSGINCEYNSTGRAIINGSHGFFALLWITVPNTTPTNNYVITVTAKIGSISHSTAILVAVQSYTVIVSGTINPSYSGINPQQIVFLDLTTIDEQEYVATITDSTYSIVLPNYKTYYVYVRDEIGKGYLCNNQFLLEVPAGSEAMTRNFTVYGD